MSEPDWKAIALELAQRVNFAMSNLKPAAGSGLIINTATLTTQHWRMYFADAMKLIPGVEIDIEMMRTMDLPMAKRRKAQKEIEARRAAAKLPGEPHE